MGGTLKGRTALTLLWVVSCALAVAVPLGLSLLSQWFVLFVWGEGYHDPLTFLIFGCLPVYLGVPALMFWYVKGHQADRAGKRKAVICLVGIVVIFGGLFSGVMFGTTYGDQQMLHDRGVTARGVVTKLEYVRGDSGYSGVETNVRLNDGKTISIFADVDGHPQVGSTVQVTSDPLGKADPQLGPRPPIPGAQGKKLSLAILIVGHIMTASSIAGPLGETLDPRRLRRRRTPTRRNAVVQA